MAKQVTLKLKESIVEVDPKYLSETGKKMVSGNQSVVGNGLARRRAVSVKPGSKQKPWD